MDDALGVSQVQRVGEAGSDPQRLAPVHRPACRAVLVERLPFEILERDERGAARLVAADVVNHDDVGVGEACGEACLGQESLLEDLALRRVDAQHQVDRLEGDRSIEGGVHGFVHDTHGALADDALDLVAPERRRMLL